MTKPTTVYIDTKILQAVKIKAVQVHTSVSHLINEALRHTLKEDMADIQTVRARRHEPARPFEDVLKSLKKDGLL